MRCLRRAASVSGPMPPALSAPSLSSTMAPSGSDDDSAITRSSVSPMRVAGSEASSASVFSTRCGSLPNLYSRTWKCEPSDLSSPPSSARLAAASRVPPASAMPMLRESSTSTATTFCCGRSVATLSAGCHSRNRISASMADSSSQMASGRAPLNMPWLRPMCQYSRPVPHTTAAASSHSGHGVSNTNWPL